MKWNWQNWKCIQRQCFGWPSHFSQTKPIPRNRILNLKWIWILKLKQVFNRYYSGFENCVKCFRTKVHDECTMYNYLAYSLIFMKYHFYETYYISSRRNQMASAWYSMFYFPRFCIVSRTMNVNIWRIASNIGCITFEVITPWISWIQQRSTKKYYDCAWRVNQSFLPALLEWVDSGLQGKGK